MKRKMKGVLGIGLAFVLLASLLTFAIPVAADPYPPLDPAKPNMWEDFDPTPAGPPGPTTDSWFFDPTITKVGPIAESPVNGDIYASVNFGTPTTHTATTDGVMLGVSSGTSTATWSFDVFQSPDYSAELNFVDGHCYVDINNVPAGITGLDFSTALARDYGFWYYQTAEAGFGPQLELRFTDPATPANFIDITFMLQTQTTLNAWTWVNIGSTFGAIGTWDGTTFTPGYTLATVQALMGGTYPTYVLTKARVELYNDPAPARIAYIDDVMIAGTCYGMDPEVKFMKSTDGGRTWTESTSPYKYFGGPVVDMVCSDLFEDVIYVTDGNYVYKSVDGAMSFAYVAKDDLEKNLIGDCGCTICAKPITCIDLGYDGSDKPVVFIGTRQIPGRIFVSPHPWEGDFVVGSVYWIADETFPASWHDLELKCYGCCDPEIEDPLVNASQLGCFDVYAVGTAPDFANSNKVYAVITTDDADCDATVDSDGDGDATYDPSTQVVYTVGTVCSWTFVSELFRNCDNLGADGLPNTGDEGNFEIRHASRIVFPSYYGTTPMLFVGVAGTFDPFASAGPPDLRYGPGGDVYRVADTFPATPVAIDLNVQGYLSGCTGLYDTNICSLDIENDALVAGAYDNWEPPTATANVATNVYYSADTGWTWSSSLKDPTGVDRTYVLFASSIVAGTRHCDCGFSLDCSTTPGVYFNQISLINMNIDAVLDLSHAPGYLDGSSIMYVLTNDEDACLRAEAQVNTSLLRWDNTYWERVFSTRTYAVPAVNTAIMDWVEVSPDFADTSCVYLANTEFEMFRSLDAGCSWAPLTFPCAPRPEISAWIVVDLETVLAAGPYAAYPQGEVVWKTTYHGAQPWIPYPLPTIPTTPDAGNGVDFDLSPTIAADNSVLLGDDTGRVFFSDDVGETWTDIWDAAPDYFFYPSGADTYVVFDPGYGTADDPGENTVYAAAGSAIGRCTIDHDLPLAAQDWLYLGGPLPLATPPQDDCDEFELCVASGIDAAGDTALYVADAGREAGQEGTVTVSGTIEVNCCVYAETEEPFPECCCDRDIVVDAADLTPLITGEHFIDGELLTILEWNLTCTLECVEEDCVCTIEGDVGVAGYESGTIGYIDISDTETLAECSCTEPVYCSGTANAVVVSSYLTVTVPDPAVAACPTGVWRTLNPLDIISEEAGLNYVEFEFLDYMLTAPSLLHPVASGSTFDVYPDDLWLTEGSNVLWALEDAEAASPTETIWMWDDVLATPVIQVAPADGTALALSTMATLEWEALDGATFYQVYVYRYCPTCPAGPTQLIEVENFETYKTCVEITDLLPGTTYYWKVRVACDSPQVSKWSGLWSFDTALSSTVYCSPECGAEDISLTPNFSWSAVVGATGYEVDVASDEDFTNIVTSGAPTINAWDCDTELDYSTTYYWRVRAISDGVPSAWTYCLFSTEAEPTTPAAPITPVTIVTEEITPAWIWVIIGIGAALVIAVIVLIVTTRRVS